VRWRPTAFLEITPSCVREYPLRVVSPRWGRSESGRSAPADLIVLKLTFRRSAMGQTRRFGSPTITSGLSPTSDIPGPGRHFAKVPRAEV